MKKFVLAAAFAGAASVATAGGMADPVEMPMIDVIEDAGSSSNSGLIIPLILVALIAAALA